MIDRPARASRSFVVGRVGRPGYCVAKVANPVPLFEVRHIREIFHGNGILYGMSSARHSIK